MAAATGGYLYHRAAPISLIQLGLILIAAGPGLSAFAESVNEIADLPIDVRASAAVVGGLRLSSGTGMLASGVLSRRTANVFVGATAILGLLAAGLLSLSSLIIYLFGLALASAYSLKPLRLKERSFLGMFAQAMGYGPIAVFLGHGTLHFDAGILERAILIGAWTGGAGLTADLLDYRSDRAARVMTVPVCLGRQGASYLILVVSSLAFIGATILQVPEIPLIAVYFALALYAIWGVLVWKYRDGDLPATVHLITLATEFVFPFYILF